MNPRLDDNDPYEPRDPGDDYDRSPDPEDYAPPGQMPRPEPTPTPRPAVGPTFVSVLCSRCGYNLTGVAIGGNCPECGAKVDDSLYAAGTAPTNGFAVTSMVIGIVSLSTSCCCPAGFLGIVGLVFGFIAMNQMKTGSYANSSRGMATAGLICSGIALLPALGWLLMAIADGF